MAALAQGRGDLLPLACGDRLHQPYRRGLVPGFDAVTHAAKGAGAAACMLSGAGPTMLALVNGTDAGLVGQGMTQAFAKAGVQSRYEVLKPDLLGARVIE